MAALLLLTLVNIGAVAARTIAVAVGTIAVAVGTIVVAVGTIMVASGPTLLQGVQPPSRPLPAKSMGVLFLHPSQRMKTWLNLYF